MKEENREKKKCSVCLSFAHSLRSVDFTQYFCALICWESRARFICNSVMVSIFCCCCSRLKYKSAFIISFILISHFVRYCCMCVCCAAALLCIGDCLNTNSTVLRTDKAVCLFVSFIWRNDVFSFDFILYDFGRFLRPLALSFDFGSCLSTCFILVIYLRIVRQIRAFEHWHETTCNNHLRHDFCWFFFSFTFIRWF